ncbi:hypothetical protein [Halolamina sp.]|uniref:hypothetical protein n=1 Tax=Halolamina sp. TaxID=1940283 RepID=UPI00356B4BD7
MSTKTPSRENGTDATELPANWTETSFGHFERDDGAVVRVRQEIPLRSAAEFNKATHTDADGLYTVLHHEEPLPSAANPVARDGSEGGARAAALDYISEECDR